MEKKFTTPNEVLCKGLPPEFINYLNYVRSLKFAEKPDYNFIKRLFKELFIRYNFRLDYLYDWCVLAKN